MSLKTYVEVNFGGKDRLLKYDFNAACDLEEHFGKGVAAILQEEQIGFRLCRGFYWAGLKWKEPGITLQRVGMLLNDEIQKNGKSIIELMEPAMEALQKSKLIAAPKGSDEFEENNESIEETEETPN